MTTPSVLQRLYYPRGPFVEEALLQRLRFHRKRFRLALNVSLISVIHAFIFFAVAWLVRHFSIAGVPADLALAIAAALIIASMGSSTIPALVEHWRSESDVLPALTVRRFRVQKPPLTPPLNAEFLFYLFLSPTESDAFLGDLEERYGFILNKFGRRSADFWYWVQVIRSLGPIVWAATKRVVRSSFGVAGLLEIWRRIRS